MTLPFTIDQFLDVFRQYNESVWPVQWILNLAAIVALGAAIKGGRGASRVGSGILAALWIWTGSVYHARFFLPINPAALFFAAAFVAEGALIAWFGVVRASLRFAVRENAAGLIGLGLIAYALVAYPMIGYQLGHRYPSAPTFGVPCPTTIFTFGMILLVAPPRARAVLVIPAVWAMVAAVAAVRLGMWEDIGLVVAAVAATMVTLLERSVSRRGLPRGVVRSTTTR